MNFFKELFSNYLLSCAIIAWITAQIIKIFTGMVHEHSFNVLNFLVGTGGMPSSHSACVTSLAVGSALHLGVGSPIFAVTAVLAIVVMRDASGVRREAGKQAKVLNQILQEIFTTGDEKLIQADLKELLGHTPLQVFVGALLGALIAVLIYPLFPHLILTV